MLALVLAAVLSRALVPIHGTVLGRVGSDRIVLKADPVTDMLPGGRGVYRVVQPARFRGGQEVDAYLDPSHRELFDVKPAAAFVAGIPDGNVTHLFAPGDRLPGSLFVDQRDLPVRFTRFTGKVLLVSFVFTLCPDRTLCPAISAKFAYLQRKLDPAHFHLIEVTLDPRYDSPPVLRAYGDRFGADPERWSLLTGEPEEVKDIADAAGIASVQDGPDNFVHDDRLLIVDGGGVIRSVIPTAAWSPDDVVAQARDVAGLASNPLRRFELATIAGVVTLCGGSTSMGVTVLGVAAMLVILAIVGVILAWFGRRIFAREETRSGT